MDDKQVKVVLYKGDFVLMQFFLTTNLVEKIEEYARDSDLLFGEMFVHIIDSHFPKLAPHYGYHKFLIEKGQLGELSKIQEELNEAIDAENQSNPLMTLQELSDIIAAISGYLKKNHPSLTIENLVAMAKATERAFAVGDRK